MRLVMTELLDVRLIAAASLWLALVIVLWLLVASSNRARTLAARLGDAEARARTAVALARRYEPFAALASTLRADLEHACVELARYRGLADAEADLARMHDENAVMLARIDAIRHAGQLELHALHSRIADLRRELDALESPSASAPDGTIVASDSHVPERGPANGPIAASG
jgi:hypothetical protein